MWHTVSPSVLKLHCACDTPPAALVAAVPSAAMHNVGFAVVHDCRFAPQSAHLLCACLLSSRLHVGEVGPAHEPAKHTAAAQVQRLVTILLVVMTSSVGSITRTHTSLVKHTRRQHQSRHFQHSSAVKPKQMLLQPPVVRPSLQRGKCKHARRAAALCRPSSSCCRLFLLH
jgi:hypothetical protein